MFTKIILSSKTILFRKIKKLKYLHIFSIFKNSYFNFGLIYKQITSKFRCIYIKSKIHSFRGIISCYKTNFLRKIRKTTKCLQLNCYLKNSNVNLRYFILIFFTVCYKFIYNKSIKSAIRARTVRSRTRNERFTRFELKFLRSHSARGCRSTVSGN